MAEYQDIIIFYLFIGRVSSSKLSVLPQLNILLLLLPIRTERKQSLQWHIQKQSSHRQQETTAKGINLPGVDTAKAAYQIMNYVTA